MIRTQSFMRSTLDSAPPTWWSPSAASAQVIATSFPANSPHSVEPLLRGAAIQPGKPIRVGRSPSGRFVVSLPGNPVSVLATACLILWPILDRLAGGDGQLPWRTVTLTEPMKPNARRFQFRPARLDPDGTATVPSWAGSGDLAHVAVTDGLLALPRQAEPVPAGNTLEFLPWPS